MDGWMDGCRVGLDQAKAKPFCLKVSLNVLNSVLYLSKCQRFDFAKDLTLPNHTTPQGTWRLILASTKGTSRLIFATEFESTENFRSLTYPY